MTPLTAFVTDGEQRPALAITRALGRRGIRVIVGSDRRTSLAASSRYCRRHVTYPSPAVDRAAFDEFLADFLAREQVDVLLPVTDVTMHAVCSHQQRLLRHCAMAVPPVEAFELVTNKWTLVQAAAHSGIRVPRTHVIAGLAGLKTHIESIEYPAVVKPSRSRIRTARGWIASGVHYVHGEDELWRLYRKTEYLASYPSLIQQRIVGPGVGVFVLCDRGRQIAAFAHRRLREKPPAGGTSVLCESIPLDPDLAAQADRLLQPLRWHGVAMLEYKRDRRSGQMFLIEVNGRFWGSLQLAIDAGVDFPFLTCELACSRPPAGPVKYEVGVRSRWLLGDLDQLLLRLFKSDAELQLPEPAPSRLRAVADFVRSGNAKVRSDVARFGDLRPFVHELGHSMTGIIHAVLRRTRSMAAHNAPCSSPHRDEYESHGLAG